MEASQRKLARERSNDALGELLQAIIYAKVDAADQENAGMLSLGVGNVRYEVDYLLIERMRFDLALDGLCS